MNNYETLGVEPGSSDEQIKTAWKKLVKENHPDLHPDDPNATDRVAKINAAYNDLMKGETGEEEFIIPDEETSFHFFRAGRGGFGFHNFHRGNPNISAAVHVTMDMIISGQEIDVQYNCPIGNPDGSRSLEQRTKTIKINCDTPVDRLIIFKGEGAILSSQFPPGDLQITLIVHGDTEHQIDGVDVHMNRQVSLVDAIVGTEIMISTLDNKKIKIAIPPGTQSGTMFKVTGKGFKLARGRADIYVHVKVNIPKITDAEATAEFKTAMAKIGII